MQQPQLNITVSVADYPLFIHPDAYAQLKKSLDDYYQAEVRRMARQYHWQRGNRRRMTRREKLALGKPIGQRAYVLRSLYG